MAARPQVIVWLLVAAWLFAGAVHARPTLVLDDSTAEARLQPYFGHHHDASAELDLAAAARLVDNGAFERLHSTALGFRDGATWLHARIVNRRADEPRWLLVQRYALSDRIDVHVRHADGRVEHHVGGDTLPFHARSIPYRHPNMWIDLPPGRAVDLFIRIESQSSMQVPFVLHTPTAFTGESRDSQLAIGLYYGILLALLFYNAVLWLSLRDANYFWYVFHIAAFGLVLLTLNGLAFEHLWPGHPRFAQISVPLSICLALAGKQQFARVFLQLSERWPLGDRGSLALIAFFVVLAAVSTVAPVSVTTRIASAAVFPSVLWVLASCIAAIRSGLEAAWLFLVAWAMFLLGTAMFAAIAFGLMPKNFVTEYGVQIGSAMEMLLLSVALGYRYASL
ncbi:MAG TPA: 7TM diverse intracellular signaling domain-containing protein, partial [Lysobacter sp.]